MAASAARHAGSGAEPLHEPLQRYLRTLWARAPSVKFTDQAPFLIGSTIHLPADRGAAGSPAAWRWYRAAAAHAAAHLAFSPAAFDGRGLPPITRALLGLLEDARVENLACRELPGLRRLWASQHTATPGDGPGFEALMLRLARSLIDPDYDDPHPWVQKGRRLFFVDAAVQILALCRPDELRRAASLLGHDIGQMRLQFNARSFVAGPDYRDDSRWMWPAGQAPHTEPAAAAGASGSDADTATVHPARPAAQHYPEWDRLISRLRHDWCAVFEDSVVPTGEQGPVVPVAAAEDLAIARRLARVLQRRDGGPASRLLAHEGDALDIDALVHARVAQRRGAAVDARIHRRAMRMRRAGRLMVLVDQSASSAGAWGPAGLDLLQASRRVAALVAAALQQGTVGTVEVAICGFSSQGRHDVAVRSVKDFTEACCPAVLERLAALRSAHSTRLGAVLRHASRPLAASGPGGALQLLVISDGEPHDIDVHDPRYLIADARHAALQARRLGLRVRCIVLGRAGWPVALQIFGARDTQVLEAMEQLPAVAARLAL